MSIATVAAATTTGINPLWNGYPVEINICPERQSAYIAGHLDIFEEEATHEALRLLGYEVMEPEECPWEAVSVDEVLVWLVPIEPWRECEDDVR